MGIKTWLKNLGNNTLYYPGCLTKGVLKEQLENYKEILNRLDIDFIMLPDKEGCCGLPVLNSGYRKDARALAKKNYDLFKQIGVKKIITNCPSCYNMFREEYPKLLREWDIEIEHITITILKALKEKGIRYNGQEEVVTYHDPCHLGRYSGIYNEPREVIKILGGRVMEMKHNRENALCCGGGGGMKANFPKMADEIARQRVLEVPSEADRVISPCGLCYSNLLLSPKSEEFSGFVLRKLNEIKNYGGWR